MNFNGLKRLAASACAAAALYAGSALPSWAQDAAPAPTLNSGDTAWMLTSTVLVLMMTIPGLALFYGGMVRKKNVLSVLMATFRHLLSSVRHLWFVAGYSLAFTDGGEYQPYIGGLSKALLAGITKDSLQGTIPELVFATFQMTFAIITPALIIGAIVDRMKFSALLIFMAAWMLLVYVPVCHWVWGGGFLGWRRRSRLRRRHGRSHQRRHRRSRRLPRPRTSHRLRHREHGAVQPRPDAHRRLAAVGRLVRLQRRFGSRRRQRRPASPWPRRRSPPPWPRSPGCSPSGWSTASRACSASPPAPLPVSSPSRRLAASSIPRARSSSASAAGVGCYICSTGLKKMLGYDDSLDVFGVHGVGGIIGAILTGVFAVEAFGGKAGLLEGNFAQVPIQVYGVLATIVWCGRRHLRDPDHPQVHDRHSRQRVGRGRRPRRRAARRVRSVSRHCGSRAGSSGPRPANVSRACAFP